MNREQAVFSSERPPNSSVNIPPYSTADPATLLTLHYDEVKSRLPVPMPVALHRTINPTSHLLFSFPIPRFHHDHTHPETLPTHALHHSTSERKEEEEEELRRVVDRMTSTAVSLLESPTYSSFFTEALTAEAAAAAVAPPALSSDPSRVNNPSEKVAKAFYQRMLASHLNGHASGSRSGPSPSPAAPPPPSSRKPVVVKREKCWVKQDSPRMSLRPRTSTETTIKKEEEREIVVIVEEDEEKTPLKRVKREKEVRKTVGVKSTATERGPRVAAPPTPTTADVTHLDQYSKNAVKDIIEEVNLTEPALQNLITILSIDTTSLKGIEEKDLGKFLVALMDSATEEEEKESRGRRKDKVTEDRLLYGRAVCGLACLVILAETQVPLTVVPRGTIGATVGLFASVVHRVRQRFGQVQLEKKEEEEEVGPSRHQVTRGKGADKKRRPGQREEEDSMIRWLELIQRFLQSFTDVICDRSNNLVSDTDVFRLEDVCLKCLFLVTQHCTPAQSARYAAYTMENAVFLYRCIWNRLEVQRHLTAEEFFSRLMLSDALNARTYHFNNKKFMPLTMAILTAAQSSPIYADTVTDVLAHRLQKQCTMWATSIIHHLLLDTERYDRNELVIAKKTVLQLTEDLANLLGAPEWPVADLLLHACIQAFHNSCTTEADQHLTSAQREGIRALSVDVFAGVALHLCDPAIQNYSSENAIQKEMEAEVAQVPMDALMLDHWKTSLALDAATTTSEETEEKNLSTKQLLLGLLYYSLSKRVERSRRSEAFSWYYTRVAWLLQWRLWEGDAAFPEKCLDGLIRDTATPCGPLQEVGGEQLCRWVHLLSASSKRSVLSPTTVQLLVVSLLSVFKGEEASETVLRKALAHLSKLTELFPGLSRYTWPITRDCVQGDSAKVREAIAPLLLTLLKGVLHHSESDPLVLSEEDEVLVTDIVSCLLHLLEDKRVVVVSRAVHTIHALLTEAEYQPLLSTPQGHTLRGFAQHKLIGLVSSDTKVAAVVTQHFLSRWVTVVEGGQGEAAVVGHPHLPTEIQSLAVLDGGEFPFEMEDDHPLVCLLRSMYRSTTAGRPIKGKGAVKESQLRSVMTEVARTLWLRSQNANSDPEAVGSLAALHSLALGCPSWVEPLGQALLELLQSTGSKVQDQRQAGNLLQTLRIMGTLLATSSSAPTLSLDQLAKSLSGVLSSYVGAYQQRIIVAACVALTAMITCGSVDKLSTTNVRTPYLVLCYHQMNNYYVRVRELLPHLERQPQGLAYLQRYLFLLSELLRLYHNWSKPFPVLTDPNLTGKVPNQLSAGNGICDNTYQLLVEVLTTCDEATKSKLAVITLKMFTSLCILLPATYWPLSEPFIKEALARDAPVALQVQGLTFIRDFLAEEDARVDLAAKLALDKEEGSRIARVGARRLRSSKKEKSIEEEEVEHDYDNDEEEEGEEEEEWGSSRKKGGLPSNSEDHNSGMATWVMQKFHSDVVRLAVGSPWSLARRRSLEILQWSVQCGLLPPVQYLDVLVALSADVDPSLRPIALECLESLSDRHENSIASLASRGVLKAYEVRHLCRVNLLHSAYTVNGMGMEQSVYGGVFEMLHQRGRDNFITSVLQLLFREDKARGIWGSHKESEEILTEAEEDNAFRAKNSSTLLAHLAAAIVFTPFTTENDVMHVLQLCGEGINYNAANMMDLVGVALESLQQSPKKVSALNQTTLHVCLGVVVLHYIRVALRAEYRLSASKLHRLLTVGKSASTTLPRRLSSSPTIKKFLGSLTQLVKVALPLYGWLRSGQCEGQRRECVAALEYVKSELETTLLENADDGMGGGASVGAKRKGRVTQRRQTATKKKKRPRRHVSSSSSSSDSEESDTSSDSSSSEYDE